MQTIPLVEAENILKATPLLATVMETAFPGQEYKTRLTQEDSNRWSVVVTTEPKEPYVDRALELTLLGVPFIVNPVETT